mmetsp:Transcript_5524/g.11488  ORF Transcript_5524/g.11488 Transcript_5524/m.11488 type:complete len:204 (-) Transcript_5524:6446-7057(-)
MKGVTDVSVIIDYRTHGSESLLHPMLNRGQGPSLIISFHKAVLEVDNLVRLSSPLNYYRESMNNVHGGGGEGYPRFGRGLCAAFNFTDCCQILLGNKFVTFDPTGEYFYDGGVADYKQDGNVDNLYDDNSQDNASSIHSRRNKGTPTARCYGIDGMISKFPDQFQPFISIPFAKSALLSDAPFFLGTGMYFLVKASLLFFFVI